MPLPTITLTSPFTPPTMYINQPWLVYAGLFLSPEPITLSQQMVSSFSGSPPPGITTWVSNITDQVGVLIVYGTPTALGTYTFNVNVNGSGTLLSIPVSLTVQTEPVITLFVGGGVISSPVYYPLKVGAPYSITFHSSTGSLRPEYEIVGTLPPGITASDVHTIPLVLSGSPTAVGTYPITVQLRDLDSSNASPIYTVIFKVSIADHFSEVDLYTAAALYSPSPGTIHQVFGDSIGQFFSGGGGTANVYRFSSTDDGQTFGGVPSAIYDTNPTFIDMWVAAGGKTYVIGSNGSADLQVQTFDETTGTFIHSDDKSTPAAVSSVASWPIVQNGLLVTLIGASSGGGSYLLTYNVSTRTFTFALLFTFPGSLSAYPLYTLPGNGGRLHAVIGVRTSPSTPQLAVAELSSGLSYLGSVVVVSVDSIGGNSFDGVGLGNIYNDGIASKIAIPYVSAGSISIALAGDVDSPSWSTEAVYAPPTNWHVTVPNTTINGPAASSIWAQAVGQLRVYWAEKYDDGSAPATMPDHERVMYASRISPGVWSSAKQIYGDYPYTTPRIDSFNNGGLSGGTLYGPVYPINTQSHGVGVLFPVIDLSLLDSDNKYLGLIQTIFVEEVVVVPLMLTCASGTASLGVTYSSSLVATGGTPPYTFSIIAGALPPGLSLNASTGLISGMLTLAGTYPYTAQVTDSIGLTATATCTIVVVGTPLMGFCPISNNVLVNVPYSSSILAYGGTPPYTYAIIAGSLPPGLTLNSSTGLISGTPTSTGMFSYTIQVTDSNGAVVTGNCSISVGSCPGAL